MFDMARTAKSKPAQTDTGRGPVTRINLSESEMTEFRIAALREKTTAPDLLAELARQYLKKRI